MKTYRQSTMQFSNEQLSTHLSNSISKASLQAFPCWLTSLSALQKCEQEKLWLHTERGAGIEIFFKILIDETRLKKLVRNRKNVIWSILSRWKCPLTLVCFGVYHFEGKNLTMAVVYWPFWYLLSIKIQKLKIVDDFLIKIKMDNDKIWLYINATSVIPEWFYLSDTIEE